MVITVNIKLLISPLSLSHIHPFPLGQWYLSLKYSESRYIMHRYKFHIINVIIVCISSVLIESFLKKYSMLNCNMLWYFVSSCWLYLNSTQVFCIPKIIFIMSLANYKMIRVTNLSHIECTRIFNLLLFIPTQSVFASDVQSGNGRSSFILVDPNTIISSLQMTNLETNAWILL